ncbi:hypothetical protein DMA11_00605 [Marinilabiliaceae bacterium JC017]|nr:hypothetical protein DMA11_00605 [Marinilabiliaceae bacterium JC017]
MMKLNILLLAIVISGLVISGYCSCSNEDNNHLLYQTEINKAEYLITNVDYQEALEIYQVLFGKYQNCFYKDIHNACLCAVKLHQYGLAMKFMEDLVMQGYELEDFSNPVFDEIKEVEVCWNSFTKKYPDVRQKYLGSLDLDLRNRYSQIYLNDQKAASSRDMRYQDSVFYYQSFILSKHIKKYGFPDWFLNKDTMNIQLGVMLRHCFGLKNRLQDSENLPNNGLYEQMCFENNGLTSILDKALCDNLILPSRYVAVVTYWDSGNPYGKIAFEVDFEKEAVFPFLTIPPERLAEVNEKRKSIGLMPIDKFTSSCAVLPVWLRNYPFKEIKQAFLNCDSCYTHLDYMNELWALEMAGKDRYSSSPKKAFILSDLSEVRELYLKGLKKYKTNLVGDGVNNQ